MDMSARVGGDVGNICSQKQSKVVNSLSVCIQGTFLGRAGHKERVNNWQVKGKLIQMLIILILQVRAYCKRPKSIPPRERELDQISVQKSSENVFFG